jgi:cyclase
MRLLFKLLVLGMFVCPRLSCVRSAVAAELPDFRRLSEGVYAHLVGPDGPFVSNAGVVVLSQGVLVFDTHFTPEGGEGLLKRIREITPRPVLYVALSHFHPDHTHGTQAFESASMVFASASARRDILERDVPALNRVIALDQAQVARMSKEFDRSNDPARRNYLRQQMDERQALADRLSKIRVRIPIAAVEHSLTIVDESRTLQFRVLGPAHTDGDMILYLPQEKIVFTGDLFFNAALPSTDDAQMISWTSTLEELLKLPATVYVPGHGAVAGRAEVEHFLQYLKDLRALVEPALERGEPLEQVIYETRIPARYAAYSFQNFFPANLTRMYSELRNLRLAAPQAKPEEEKKKPDGGYHER